MLRKRPCRSRVPVGLLNLPLGGVIGRVGSGLLFIRGVCAYVAPVRSL